MPLFRRSAQETPEPEVIQPLIGKGAPTPKRSERVSANQRPLVPGDRKAAKQEARATMAVEREKARKGFERGEEKYLPVRDRGEVRRYVRDYVDARLSIATLMIPAMVVVILLTFYDDLQVRLIANYALWGFIVLAVLDCLLLGWLVNRRITAKFGPGQTKGNTWYAAMRAAQMPFMRMPKPQVKLFRFPE